MKFLFLPKEKFSPILFTKLNNTFQKSNFIFFKDFIYIQDIKNNYNVKEKYMARDLISMPEEFLSRIDQVAEGENRTRSELIREALRSYMYKSRVKSSTMATKNAAILEALLD